TLAVASSVVSDNTEAATECRDDRVPGAMIDPGAVNEHEGITTVAGELPMESDSINQRDRNGEYFLIEENARATILSSSAAPPAYTLCRTGSVKVNVEPTPNSLLAQIRPPCSSTNFRHKVSPSPVPSTFFAAVPTWRNSSNTFS